LRKNVTKVADYLVALWIRLRLQKSVAPQFITILRGLIVH